jgi:hypothetical protein
MYGRADGMPRFPQSMVECIGLSFVEQYILLCCGLRVVALCVSNSTEDLQARDARQRTIKGAKKMKSPY